MGLLRVPALPEPPNGSSSCLLLLLLLQHTCRSPLYSPTAMLTTAELDKWCQQRHLACRPVTAPRLERRPARRTSILTAADTCALVLDVLEIAVARRRAEGALANWWLAIEGAHDLERAERLDLVSPMDRPNMPSCDPKRAESTCCRSEHRRHLLPSSASDRHRRRCVPSPSVPTHPRKCVYTRLVYQMCVLMRQIGS